MSVNPSPTPAPAPVSVPGLPVKVRVALSLAIGALSVLNITTFGFGGDASTYISAALAFFGYIGIGPVTGDAFQKALLDIFPAAWVQTIHGVLGAAVAAASVLVATAHWSTAATAVVVGVITELGALGFGPTGTN